MVDVGRPMHLVPEDEMPKALAIFNGGNALATVIATPLGSYLGGVMLTRRPLLPGAHRAHSCLSEVSVLM